MIKTKRDIIITLVAALLISACSIPFRISRSRPDMRSTASEAWQEQVDAIKALTRRMAIPEHLLYEDGSVGEDDFNPLQFLEILEHLQIRPGYQLDFVYFYDGGRGRPYLYARQSDSLPLQTYQAYLDAIEKCNQAASVILCSHMDAIITDGTDASYFQWVLLHQMGEQFYLYWHALYLDHEIIASREALTNLVELFSDSQDGDAFTSRQKRSALNIDPAPSVLIEEDRISVRVIVFTKWGGFYEAIYDLSAKSPHQLINIEMKNLVPYDIDIMF